MREFSVDKVNRPPLGLSYGGFSRELRRWVRKSPHQRLGIVRMVYEFAQMLPEGTRVLDLGAGNAPYRELFHHCQYTTADHVQRKPPVDLVCAMHAVPLPDASFDAVLCTEVLEHVPSPSDGLAEIRRLLAPGGYLCLTMPFMLGVHEAHDYTRFTAGGLKHLCEEAGFEVMVLTPRHGLPMTLWSMIWAVALRVAHPGGDLSGARTGGRVILGAPMLILSVLSFFPLRMLDSLDKTQEFTLGYAALLRRPE